MARRTSTTDSIAWADRPLFRTSHGVAPSPWIVSLPYVIRAPIIALYVDTLRPSDDFLAQLRNLVISVGFIFAVAALFTLIFNNFTVEGNTTAPAILARCILPPLFAVVFAASYAVLRLTALSLDLITGAFIYVLVLNYDDCHLFA